MAGRESLGNSKEEFLCWSVGDIPSMRIIKADLWDARYLNSV